MFEFEYGYPCCSCYTEQDLKYLASESKSFVFNKDKFSDHSGWMGIREDGKQLSDAIEKRYFVKNKKDYGNYTGSALYQENRDPFFFRWGDEVCFTILAIFAGRGDDKKTSSLKQACDVKCFICDAKESRRFAVLDFKCDRFEAICSNCYEKWVKFRTGSNVNETDWWYNRYLRIDTKEQIQLIRFVVKNRKLKRK